MGQSTHSSANSYLFLYNVLSATLRLFILLRTVHLWLTIGNVSVWNEMHVLVQWMESLTFLEVAHAAIGIVRASPSTTALQVAGRNTIVWAITRNYPEIAVREWAYSTMLVAWNMADVVRYTFFTVEKGTGSVYKTLLWLRYVQRMFNLWHNSDQAGITCLLFFIQSAFCQKLDLFTRLLNLQGPVILFTSIFYGLD